MNNNKTTIGINSVDNSTAAFVPSRSGNAIDNTRTAIAPSDTSKNTTSSGNGIMQSASLVNIPLASFYILNGIQYNTIHPISYTSGEAIVILVENSSKQYCLKIYKVGHIPDVSLLEVVKKARGGFLISLYDHGIWREPTFGNNHYYEVMDYAEYGALDKFYFTTEEQFIKAAMRMAMCIHQCHELNIVHRDVKPENFLCVDNDCNQFVLSDFGIARMINSCDQEACFDIAKSGYFVSPEGAMTADNRTSVVGYATDYYSMGMTLLAMVIGTNKFYNSISPNDLLRYKSNNIVVDHFVKYLTIGGKPMSEYAISLLRGLLQLRPNDRIGFDDIKKWYISNMPISTSPNNAITASQIPFAITFDDNRNLVAHSQKQLAKMMLDNFDYAKQFLYRGLLKKELERINKVSMALAVDRIVEQVYPSIYERDAGLYAVILLLDPGSPFIGLTNNICYSIEDIKNEIWNNRVYYSHNLASHGAALWAYLAANSDIEIRNLEAKYRQIILRSQIHGIYSLCRKLDPTFPFYTLNGLPITTTKELAVELWSHRQQYVKDLTNSEHSLWLYLSCLGEDGVKLSQEYSHRLQIGNESELFALCYHLDCNIPYYGKEQTICRTEKQLASELWHHRLIYQEELRDSSHIFWKYLGYKGDSWAKIVHDYPILITQDAEVWIFDLIYRLDPSIPYFIQYEDDKQWHGQRSIEDIINNVSIHGITDLSLSSFSKQHFQTWLTLSSNEYDKKCGLLLAKLVKDAGSDADKKGWFFLYNFAPQADLLLIKNGDLYSADQIGKEINDQLIHAKAESLIDLQVMLNMDSFKNSRLYQYFEARKMHNYNKGIESIIDIHANETSHPSTPYNQIIATWKVIQLLGTTPYYIIKDKRISTLDDVKNMQDIANAEINNGLAEYLTVFFHERVDIKFSFDEILNYYNFLLKYCPQYYGLQKTSAMRASNANLIDLCRKSWSFFEIINKLSFWLIIIPMIISILLSFYLYSYCAGIKIDFFDNFGNNYIIDALESSLSGFPRYLIGIAFCVAAFLSVHLLRKLDNKNYSNISLPRLMCFYVFQSTLFLASLCSFFADHNNLEFVFTFVIFPLSLITLPWIIYTFKITKSSRFVKGTSFYLQIMREIELLHICETFGTLKRTLCGKKMTVVDDINASLKRANDYKRYSIGFLIGITTIFIISIWINVKLCSEYEKLQILDPHSYELTHPENLDLQVFINGKYYYFNEQEYRQYSKSINAILNKKSLKLWFTNKRGIYINYCGCSPFIFNYDNNFIIDDGLWCDKVISEEEKVDTERSIIVSNHLPYREQILILFEHLPEIEKAANSYDPQSICDYGRSSIMYWTGDECDNDSAWAYDIVNSRFVKEHKYTRLEKLYVRDIQ